ncbi:Protein MAIN-LIKE 2 [Glycine soja]
MYTILASMASSSSSSSSIHIKSGPIEGDILWLQPKHVSEHVWNGEADRKLHIRRAEGELQGSVVKLSWLAHHFSEINIHDGNVEQLQRFTRAWILRFIGGVLFVDKSSCKVSLRYLQFLRDFEQCSTYAWGHAVLAYLYREMCSATNYKIKSIGGMCILIQMWAWECCTTLAPKRTPPIMENKPLGHKWLRRGNQHIGNDDLIVFHRKLDIMKRHEGEVTETLQYMVSPQGRNTWTVDDLVPYVEKLAILSQDQERITEPVAHGPASERRFPPQQFHMLQSSVETRGFDRRREIVQAEDFSQHMEQRGHGMYYTPPTFAQYPSQMYQYPFEGHDTDMSASEHSFGGVAETQPHFSWPTMTHSQQHDAPMATPNAPLGQQWDVPGAIPAMGDLLGVDLRHEFSVEVEEQGRRQRARRNPDRQARRWDRPCGTSSRHHGHHND